jgi:hypothetical protein
MTNLTCSVTKVFFIDLNISTSGSRIDKNLGGHLVVKKV